MNQNMIALEKANEIRTECAAYRRRIASGEISLVEAIKTCELPISAYRLLKAAPRWGEVRARKAITASGLASRHIKMGGSRFGTITQTERARLIKAVLAPSSYYRRILILTSEQSRMIERRMVNNGCTDEQVKAVLAA